MDEDKLVYKLFRNFAILITIIICVYLFALGKMLNDKLAALDSSMTEVASRFDAMTFNITPCEGE